jgi:collagenase-like PrtC family protease
MVLLNVPFIPDPQYAAFLSGLGRQIFAVHFSLYDPQIGDARVRLHTIDMQTPIRLLRTIPGPKKYLLVNGRFHLPQSYGMDGGTSALLQPLEKIQAAGVADGIIFSDPFLLLALSDAAPDLAGRFEAVPSVNFSIDSVQKLEAVLDLIRRSRFRMPGKICLDRSLNRRPQALADLVAIARRRWPQIKFELLANEGCLPQCPFRSTHEALIAAANARFGIDGLRLNRDLGCMRMLSESPHRIFASPFIRPEEMQRYGDLVDIFKICGRTLGREFLMRTVAAFSAQHYAGNLLDLLDASHWMAEKWEILNPQLPEDLFDRLTGCDQLCSTCTHCRDLFQHLARPRPFTLPDLHQPG